MARDPTLLVRDALLADRDELVDVSVEDGRIAAVEPDLPGDAETEIDAGGRLVSPGLVDAHVHLDMARSGAGDRLPRNNEGAFDRSRAIERTAEYFADASADEIEETVREMGDVAVANGVLHVRTHAYVDGEVGTKVVQAVLAAREALADRLDLQVVCFPQRGIVRDSGSEDAVRAGLDRGADLVGGLDPASINDDVGGTIDAWFDVAAARDADLDVHLHDRGTLGAYTLDRLAAETVDRGYEGRVTASHAYALADAAAGDPVSGGPLEPAVERFAAADLSFITCYQSTKPGMPIRRFHDAGLPMAHGTDQVRDLWKPHGNLDALEAMLVESIKLEYTSNPDLLRLWGLVTTGGATVLGIDDAYGIEPGTPADLVVHGAVSPHWAITERPSPEVVIKSGRVVARGGEVLEPTPPA